MSDPVLYHFAFDPASRSVRLALGEAKLSVVETPVRPWEDDCPVGPLNPSGMPPVLETAERGRPLVLCELNAIMGWVEDGVKGVAFVEACIASSRRNGAWVKL